MKHSTALQLSLLVALGIVPAACGGTTRNGPDEETGGSAGNGTGGTHTTGGSNQGGAGGNSNNHFPCTSPQVDPISGVVTCAEGYSHRPQSGVCGAVTAHKLPPPGSGAAPGASQPRADGTVPCGDDPTICAQFLYGYCASPIPVGAPASTLTCKSGCASDFDCGTGEICSCSSDPNAAVPGVCLATTCQTDQDCDTGFCASTQSACGGGGFACQTADDQCQTNADCNGKGICSVDGFIDTDPPQYFRVCSNVVCGRPFVVEQQARVAPVVSSAAWTAAIALSPRLDDVTTSERAAQAEHWTRMGQMEHASIAAFARFSLQLLALGAPPELVDACTQALADETTHTKLCFALASAYAGRAIGPGPLDVGRSLEVTSLADIVDLVIVEGCFGETSAALEALEAADVASDPVIVAVYSQIARDEQRHAELAFRFVRWALGRDGETVAARIQAALEAPLTAQAQAVALPCLEALLQIGVHATKYAAA